MCIDIESEGLDDCKYQYKATSTTGCRRESSSGGPGAAWIKDTTRIIVLDKSLQARLEEPSSLYLIANAVVSAFYHDVRRLKLPRRCFRQS